ncbi:MAG TPA: gluconeogenesis factor YvcK family protein [Chloroflexota bacterium]|nr:gluconeogenesis factor YvcK family protein [Chloroflexota bacterium]
MIQPTSLPAPERRARLWRWLRPGLSIKRWIFVYFVALTLLALGLGLVLTHMYRTAPFPGPVYYVTLQFIPRLLRGVLFLALGGGLMAWATLRIISSFVGLLVPHYRGRLGDALYTQRVLSRGPKVVAIGGGTGLSSLLRGLKEYTSNITAVVTVCDDGGSSGRLRRDLRVLPPGDFRQCIAALADSDPLVTKLFEHRFQAADRADGTGHSELKGHAFGNLFIAAMAQITGSFERALEESSRVLAVRGRILPSTLEDVVLCAELADSSTVQGESLIPEKASGGQASHDADGAVCADPDAASTANPIKRVFLEPERPAVYPEVVRSLLDADLVVIGPGSLFTSILPNLLVDDLARALCWSRAKKVYVCNVATQPGETDHYEVADHVRVIYDHLRARLGVPIGRRDGMDVSMIPFTHVLVNDNLEPHVPAEWGVTRPSIDDAALAELAVEAIHADVVDSNRPTRHDPLKLAATLIETLAATRTAQRPAPLAALKAAKALATSLL